MKINIDKRWKEFLRNEFNSENFKNLGNFLEKEYQEKSIFPESKNIFRAFNEVSFEKIKVIIIGQDPYHTPGIAEGLCFSIPREAKVLPSIKNIYKEMESDLKIKKDFSDGNLEHLAKQGVLLLNQVLTVEAHKPGSHGKKGGENFTHSVIKKISSEKENIVFILWGNNAQKVEEYIFQPKKHLILKSPHPSPLGAYRGFFGCRHFSKTNKFLEKKNIKKIDW